MSVGYFENMVSAGNNTQGLASFTYEMGYMVAFAQVSFPAGAHIHAVLALLGSQVHISEN